MTWVFPVPDNFEGPFHVVTCAAGWGWGELAGCDEMRGRRRGGRLRQRGRMHGEGAGQACGSPGGGGAGRRGCARRVCVLTEQRKRVCVCVGVGGPPTRLTCQIPPTALPTCRHHRCAPHVLARTHVAVHMRSLERQSQAQGRRGRRRPAGGHGRGAIRGTGGGGRRGVR